MSDTIDCVVVGGGVVGLAIGRQLALSGYEVAILESEKRIGAHTSSRNSEVIHAGIYYAYQSLKANLCLSGKRLLYQYCEARGVPHAKLGKLIVANGADEVQRLRDILERGVANGVTDLEWLEAAEVKALEPRVRADAAIHSPSTGIVDSHALMMSLHGEVEGNGGAVVLGQTVSRVAVRPTGFALYFDGEAKPAAYSRSLINAAGLWASSFARTIDGLDSAFVPETRYAKGHYFDYPGPAPFRRLVYPVPIVGGLGIHATLDLSGRTRFGPDAEWVDAVDYDIDDSRQAVFSRSIAAYFPGVDEQRLSPAYAGVRPKLYSPEERPSDFVIAGPVDHGVPGLVNLFGIESPGLTACLAIAAHVAERVSESGN